MTPYLDDGDVRIFAGDCVEVMRDFPDASVHSVVTDPPAGISFMGREWDHHRGGRDAWVAWLACVMRECHRLLMPGGHALVWSIPRTAHWTALALEDAGFEIRDCLTHLFGSGFPKSADVSKAIDREAWAEREVVEEIPDRWAGKGNVLQRSGQEPRETAAITTPATSDAERWQGWGTALKPAAEFWWLARKPLAERTIARQVLATGTGALNVDAGRIGETVKTWPTSRSWNGWAPKIKGDEKGETQGTGAAPAGRWPANVVLDEEAARALDEASGERPSGARAAGAYGGIGSGQLLGAARSHVPLGAGGPTALPAIEANTGGASRFFYTAPQDDDGRGRAGEASADRRYTERGSSDFAPLPGARREDEGGTSRFFYTAKAGREERDGSTHPTVKPLALMRWLVRLVTPPGGTILDPFAGSGTTLLAAREEGFRAIGIERETEYLADAARRLRQLSLFSEAQ